MTEIFDFISKNWGIIVSVSASVTAISVFIKNILSIQKLRLEIRKLKTENESSKSEKISLIREASMEEIEKYNSKYRGRFGVMHAFPPGVIETIIDNLGKVPSTSLLSSILLVFLIMIDSDAMAMNLLSAAALFVFTASSLTFLLDKTITSRFIDRLDCDAP